MDAETNNIAFLNLHRAQCPILPRDPPSQKGLGQQYEKS